MMRKHLLPLGVVIAVLASILAPDASYNTFGIWSFMRGVGAGLIFSTMFTR